MKIISAFGLIAFALVLFVCCPLALIWSINTLFNTHIGYGFINWIAAAILYYSFSRPSAPVSVTKTKI